MIEKSLFCTALVIACGISAAGQVEDRAKIALVNKIYKDMRFLPYADANLIRLAKLGEHIEHTSKAITEHSDLGCEMWEHGYLGMGNGDSEIPHVQKLKIQLHNNGWVKTQYMAEGKEKRTVDFLMICQGNVCKVSDVVLAGVSSYKKDWQYVVKHKKCPLS